MDSMDNFRERFEALEQQTKAMEAHTRTVERRQRRRRGLWSMLVLGLLILPLTVRTVEAQTNTFTPVYLPISLCSSSNPTFTLSGLPVPTTPTLLCPVIEIFNHVSNLQQNFFLKSSATLLRVFYLNKVGGGTFTVQACSQETLMQTHPPQFAHTCAEKTGNQNMEGTVGSVDFNLNEVRFGPCPNPTVDGVPAPGSCPWTADTETGIGTAFGYIRLEFSGTVDAPDQIVAGIFFF
jgi:hypothetical protein